MPEESSAETVFHTNVLQVKVKTLQNVNSNCKTELTFIEDITKRVLETSQLCIADNVSLAANNLSHLSTNFIEILSSVICLNLSNNLLNDLPASLNSLRNLQHLNIDSNKFLNIPSVIGELDNLKSLKASKNQITEIQSNLNNLRNLEELDLSSNALKDLPASWKTLNVQHLFLADNKFNKIPDCILNGMYDLRTFDFSQNTRAELNVSPCSTNLTSFYATKCNICPSFPNWILYSRYRNLKIVLLDETNFRRFDFFEGSWNSSIIRLSMRNCKLSDTIIQKIITKVSNLEELIIGNTENKLNQNSFWYTAIEALVHPLQLKEIDLANTGISAISKSIDNFHNLSIINVSYNNISWLPDEICSLKCLKTLIINDNRMTLLPDNIGELISLTELKACNNILGDLPDSMRFLNDLKFVDFYNNELIATPEVLQKLPNLLGLDLEQNFFSTGDVSINRDLRNYESMKASLREHWPESRKLHDGIKTEPEVVESRRTSSLSSMDEIENLEDYYSACTLSEKIKNTNDIMNERWDISEDSADDFDPNENKEPKMRSCSPLEFEKLKRKIFCPAASHQARIITRIRKMLQNGTLKWSMNSEEGQFEDP